ncbi:hypothetical protein [Amycolatopsis nigrescens]|uniref:hypothetical protein n=1 Tax=Amycolatopsis nigrescens TaxID=381445 RepID=UPI0003719819|nr:hypothetical protein [Amycolatopsis nigrescens]
MNGKRPWIVAGATLVLAGFGTAVATASADVPLNDPAPVSVVQQADPGFTVPGTMADNSPESADSPAASPVDSANSATDSPDDLAVAPTGTTDDTGASADSPG